MDKNKKNVTEFLQARSFQLQLHEIFPSTKNSTILLKYINEIFDDPIARSKAIDRQRVNGFIEIVSWFQFMNLKGEGLLEFYYDIIKSDIINKEKVEQFLEYVCEKILLQHQKEEIYDFVNNKIPDIIKLFQMRKITASTQDTKIVSISSNYPNIEKKISDGVEIIIGVLRKTTYFCSEDICLLKKKALIIQTFLFDDLENSKKETWELKKESIKEILLLHDAEIIERIITTMKSK
jgi:hypothetical protein